MTKFNSKMGINFLQLNIFKLVKNKLWKFEEDCLEIVGGGKFIIK